MSLDFFELVDELSEKDLLHLHKSLISRRLYDNMIDLSDIGEDIDKIRNIVPIPLQKMSYEDLYIIAPEEIKTVLSTYIDIETAVLDADPIEDSSNIPVLQPESKEQLEARVIELTSVKGKRGRLPAENREEVRHILTTLNKLHNCTIAQLAELISMSDVSVNNYIQKYIKDHPFEEHRWNPAAKAKAEKMAGLTLTNAAGSRADALVESYLSVGEWVMETYSFQAMSFGLNIKEYIRMVCESYDPESHVFTMDLIRKKDEYFNEIQVKSNRINRLQLLILHLCVSNNNFDLLRRLILNKELVFD